MNSKTEFFEYYAKINEDFEQNFCSRTAKVIFQQNSWKLDMIVYD